MIRSLASIHATVCVVPGCASNAALLTENRGRLTENKFLAVAVHPILSPFAWTRNNHGERCCQTTTQLFQHGASDPPNASPGAKNNRPGHPSRYHLCFRSVTPAAGMEQRPFRDAGVANRQVGGRCHCEPAEQRSCGNWRPFDSHGEDALFVLSGCDIVI